MRRYLGETFLGRGEEIPPCGPPLQFLLTYFFLLTRPLSSEHEIEKNCSLLSKGNKKDWWPLCPLRCKDNKQDWWPLCPLR
jgi:hypothetical protein